MSLKPHQPLRKSTRLQGYDYAQNGAYFVTLCTQNRLCLFGEIEAEETRPNDSGEMILHWCHELKTKFSDIELDSYVLMPNHLHTIIVLFDMADSKGVHIGTPLQNHPLDNIMQW